MTWGQLRLQLQTAAPGVSLDLLDEYLNVRYEQVLMATDWQGLKYHGTITTTAAHQSSTDTATFTVGSTTVTGSGTAWTTAITGQRIYRPGDSVIYTATYGSSTSITLDRAYEGVAGDATGKVYSAAAFVTMQHIYALPADARSPVTILDPLTGFPLQRLSKSELDQSAGTRTRIDDPACFAEYDDTPETSLPVSHQIEFYPPPKYARGFTLEYLHAAVGFNGSNTGAAPLPFVSMSVLLYGCRADIATYLAGQTQGNSVAIYLNQARMYEAKFAEELGRMLRVEHQQRRKLPVMKMADRFTRHRLERGARGMSRPIRDGGTN